MRTAEQKPTDRLIVALDYAGWAEAEQLVQLLPEVEYFKVGLELYLASRGEAVARLREMGKKVFLDLKFHDIPNTVARASAQAVEQGATIFNVHAGGGRRMMELAAQTAREKTKESGSAAPLVIAVTVLTSFDEAGLREVGLEGIEKTVVNYARLAEECGLDGVVALHGKSA